MRKNIIVINREKHYNKNLTASKACVRILLLLREKNIKQELFQ